MGGFDEIVFDEDSFGVPFVTGYDMSAIVETTFSLEYCFDACVSDTVLALVNYDLTIASDRVHYQMMVTLSLDESSEAMNESALDTIIWSYDAEMERVNTALQTVSLRKELRNVAGADLDEHWGTVLDLKRRTGEIDADYKRRLITRTSVLTSSGTEPNCTAIIESILHTPDVVDLISYWPAEVLVRWRSIDAMKLAQLGWDVLEDALDQMIPAGVTWYTLFPYIEHDMVVGIEGTRRISHDFGLYSTITGFAHHRMMTSIVLKGTKTQDFDVYLEKTLTKSYMMGMSRPWATRPVTASFAVVMEGWHKLDQDFDVDILKRCTFTHPMDLIDEKLMVIDCHFRSLLEKLFKRSHNMDVTLA